LPAGWPSRFWLLQLLRVGAREPGQRVDDLEDVGQFLRVAVGGEELGDFLGQLVPQPGRVFVRVGGIDPLGLWIPENTPGAGRAVSAFSRGVVSRCGEVAGGGESFLGLVKFQGQLGDNLAQCARGDPQPGHSAVSMRSSRRTAT
jgi:hypothetical protein